MDHETIDPLVAMFRAHYTGAIIGSLDSYRSARRSGDRLTQAEREQMEYLLAPASLYDFAMEHTPRHPQPFTFSQASQFDLETIVKEISRLENSLRYLSRTQDELEAFLSGQDKDDIDLLEALRDNEAVIASQSERISMLKRCLEEKGIYISSPHLNIAARNDAASATVPQEHSLLDGGSSQESSSGAEDYGIYL